VDATASSKSGLWAFGLVLGLTLLGIIWSVVGWSVDSASAIVVVVFALGAWWVRREHKRRQAEAREQAERERRDAELGARRAYHEAELVAAHGLMQRHPDIVRTFCRVVEGRVLIDEYGDEDVAALPEEVERAVKKLAGREDVSGSVIEQVLVAQDGDEVLAPVVGEFWDEEGQSWVPRDSVLRWKLLASLLVEEFTAKHAELLRNRERSPQEIDAMTGVEFESYVARRLRDHGFEVCGTPITGDQGADLIATKDGRTAVIQTKRYSGNVGNAAVQEVLAARTFYDAPDAWVITNSTFTPAARALATKGGVRLVDGPALSTLGNTLRELGYLESGVPIADG
jgi:hypothetical protein